MKEILVQFMGGAISTRPAGVFLDEATKTEVPYNDAIVVTYGRRSVTLSPEHAKALYEAIHKSPEIKAELGIKGLLG